jgi:hypothetical protein
MCSIDLFGLGLRGAAADTASFRAVQMVGRNPALIVALGASRSSLFIARGKAGGRDRSLALALRARLALGSEKCLGPGIVDEVDGANEATAKEEVEEQPGYVSKWRLSAHQKRNVTFEDPE